MATERDSKGRFPKGKSGNPAGGKRGPRKGLTDRQRADMLSKGTTEALQAIRELMGDENSNVRLKAAVTWVTEDYKMREYLLKKVKQEADLKAKNQETESSQVEESQPSILVSLKTVD